MSSIASGIFSSLKTPFQEQQYDMPAYIRSGFLYATNPLNPEPGRKQELSMAEHKVFWLYALLLRDSDNMCVRGQPQWIDFRFCFWPDGKWKIKIADSYLNLAQRASLTSVNELLGGWLPAGFFTPGERDGHSYFQMRQHLIWKTNADGSRFLPADGRDRSYLSRYHPSMSPLPSMLPRSPWVPTECWIRRRLRRR